MKPHWERHNDDHGIDEIHFVGGKGLPQTYDESCERAFMRLGLVERYKTSDLSGDEWRFSAAMHLRKRNAARWKLTSSGYSSLEIISQTLYPELFGDFVAGKNPWLYSRKVAAVTFSWKGLPVYSSSYDGKASDLLVACGHLSWAMILAWEEGKHPDGALTRLCCQPGCRELHTTVYRIKKAYCRSCWGKKSEVYSGALRGFCAKHAQRGDCALEDADRNYEVVSGHGPGGNEPDASVISPAQFGGCIDLRGQS